MVAKINDLCSENQDHIVKYYRCSVEEISSLGIDCKQFFTTRYGISLEAVVALEMELCSGESRLLNIILNHGYFQEVSRVVLTK